MTDLVFMSSKCISWRWSYINWSKQAGRETNGRWFYRLCASCWFLISLWWRKTGCRVMECDVMQLAESYEILFGLWRWTQHICTTQQWMSTTLRWHCCQDGSNFDLAFSVQEVCTRNTHPNKMEQNKCLGKVGCFKQNHLEKAEEENSVMHKAKIVSNKMLQRCKKVNKLIKVLT